MKKTALILIISGYLLSGCHSKNSSTTGSANIIDTLKIHAAPQQLADTSVKDGEVIKHYPNGVIKERSNYSAGRRDGECQSFYQNGKLWSDDYFTKGVLDGATIVYYDNGQKEFEGTYTKGKPSGTWKFYDNTGKLTRTKVYGK
jgi:hypothetical protein